MNTYFQRPEQHSDITARKSIKRIAEQALGNVPSLKE